MPHYLLDTCFIVDYYKGIQVAHERFEQILSGEATAAFSVITEMELWRGLADAAEEEKHEAILMLLQRVDVNSAIAREAARLMRELKRQGQKIGEGDALIPATARLTNAKLLTRNRHFERLTPSVHCDFY